MMRALLSVGVATMLGAAPAAAQDMVLSGAVLVDPITGSATPDSVIVVRDGVIEAAGKRDKVRAPKDLPVVDAAGKWVVPGYVDAHVHFFQSGGLYTRPDAVDLQNARSYTDEIALIRNDIADTFARQLASGITAVADVGGPMANFVVRQQAQESARAPRVAAAGPLISTWQPPILADVADPAIVTATTPDEARALVRAQLPGKPDFIKLWYVVMPGEDPAKYLPVASAVIDEAHKAGLRAAVHAPELETARAALKAGADILVHGVEDKPVDAAFLDLLKQRGALYSTTLDVFNGYMRSFTGAHAFTPQEYALADPDVMGTLLDGPTLPDSESARWLKSMAGKPISTASLDMLKANLVRVRDAGVPIVMGTDAGNIGTLHGPAIFREFARMAEAGMTPRQILASATVGGAQLMGWQDRIGRIAKGRLADMVVLDADPLADSANLSKIAMVVKGGKAFTQHDLVPQSPAEVVQRQVNAYNAHDLDAFLATYAEDAELLDFPAKSQLKGREALRAMYTGMFAQAPQIHVAVPRRTVVGDYVIDEEAIGGVPGMSGMKAVAIYEVRGGLIRKVTFINEPMPTQPASAAAEAPKP